MSIAADMGRITVRSAEARDEAAWRHLWCDFCAFNDVWRLQIPTLQIGQINVGEKQINMAATGAQQANFGHATQD